MELYSLSLLKTLDHRLHNFHIFREMADYEGQPSSEDNLNCEESTRLLSTASSDHDRDSNSSSDNLVSSLTTRQKLTNIWALCKIPTLCFIFAILFDGGDTLRSTPKTRLLESIICNRYFAEQTLHKDNFGGSLNDHFLPIPEENCKVAPVQAELVTMKAWLSVGESILGALYATYPANNFLSQWPSSDVRYSFRVSGHKTRS